jgi:hypothetical protein
LNIYNYFKNFQKLAIEKIIDKKDVSIQEQNLTSMNVNDIVHFLVSSSVVDPDDFWPDPYPTLENVRIRIRIQIMTYTNILPSFF